MFNFDKFARVATAAVGALVLSTATIAAAVGPGHAVGTERSPAAFAIAATDNGDRAHG